MTIVVVGFTARAMAASAVSAGYAVRTVDFFGDEDLRRLAPNLSLDRDLRQPYSAGALLAAAMRDPVDTVVWLASLENHPGIISAFARRCRVLGSPADSVARVRDWTRLARALNTHGIRTPRTLQPGDDVPSGSWLAKPRRSGGGHGIHVWRGDVLDEAWLLQERVNGIPCSVSFAADGRRAILLGISEQLIGRAEFGASGFRYCGSIYPLLPPPPLALRDLVGPLQEMVQVLAAEFGLLGVGGVDFILGEGGEVVPVEVNPRFTASMELIERAGGPSVFDVHVRSSTGGIPLLEWDPFTDGYWGKAVVFAGRDVRVPDTGGWFDRGIADIPHSGQSIAAGHPVCTVFARATSRDACLAGLIARADEIREELDAQVTLHAHPGTNDETGTADQRR
jgi:predicted ATP-grasp superfamily ATP-dependent carboligase